MENSQIYLRNKGLIFTIYIGLLQSNRKKDKLNQEMGNKLEQAISSQSQQQVRERMLSVVSHQQEATGMMSYPFTPTTMATKYQERRGEHGIPRAPVGICGKV